MNTPRYQHLPFHRLKTGEDFFYRKYRYYKASFFTGRAILDGDLVFVLPWTRVRSARPFGVPKFTKGTNNVYFGERTVAEGQQVNLCSASMARPVGASSGPGAPTPAILKLREELGREPQVVTPGGDRTPEAIGGNELTPSA